MQSKWDAFKGAPAILLIAAICLLTAGFGGYYLLQEPEPVIAETVNTPPPETAVAAPVPDVRHEEPTPPPVSTPIPEPEEIAASEPEFIPDDSPVIITPPQVIVAPLDGEVVGAFSVDQLVYNETLADWRTHDGIDIAAAAGSDVLAASSGTIVSVDDDPLMGTIVTIDHTDGCRTMYANLQSNPPISPGESVSAGQRIGAVGTSTAEAAQGPHLHFSVLKDGISMDPNEYLH